MSVTADEVTRSPVGTATPLAGTAALITGASSGIGEATARALAAQGAAVAVLGRRGDRLQKLAEELGEAGRNALWLAADVGDPRQAAAAVEKTVGEFGRLDTVVNNAGLMLTGPVADAPPGEWEQMIAVNVHGVLNVTRAALPHLIAAAGSAPRQVADLVNISSTAGRVARPGTAVYSLTKSGVNAFSEALRQEVQPHRVRVSVVEPGTVDTELTTHLRPGIKEAVAEQIGRLRLLQPRDIADAVVYILTRDPHVAVNEILIRASDQTW